MLRRLKRRAESSGRIDDSPEAFQTWSSILTIQFYQFPSRIAQLPKQSADLLQTKKDFLKLGKDLRKNSSNAIIYCVQNKAIY